MAERKYFKTHRGMVTSGDRERPRDGYSSWLHLGADPGDEAALSQDVVGRLRSDHLALDNPVIHNWLTDCLSHRKCRVTLSGTESVDPYESPLPSRCVEIDLVSGNVLLKETKDITGAYITLSHRWGTETEASKTTTENYAARLQHIDITSFPKTFQDAIIIAKYLEVRYLWIDSLCIIQGETGNSDWKVEAPRMADYYQHSLVTLAEISATGGLLPPRKGFSDHRMMARLPYRDNKGTHKGLFYAFQYTPLNNSYRTRIAESELIHRGWVYQEWILSRRILCFTPSSAVFHCRSLPPRNEWDEEVYRGGSELNMMLKYLFNVRDPPYRTHEKLWLGIIRAYSRLSLTCPDQDRLFALSGIAKEIFNAMELSRGPEDLEICYASGLWKHNLYLGLLWSLEKPGPHRRLRGFPSWSWASVLAPVIWIWPEDETIHPFCENITLGSCSNTDGTATEDEASPVRNSGDSDTEEVTNMTGSAQSFTSVVTTLRICGFMKSVLLDSREDLDDIARTLRSPEAPYDALGEAWIDSEPLISPDGPLLQESGPQELSVLSIAKSVYEIYYGPDDEDDNLFDVEEEMREAKVYVLILNHVSDGTFERIGSGFLRCFGTRGCVLKEVTLGGRNGVTCGTEFVNYHMLALPTDIAACISYVPDQCCDFVYDDAVLVVLAQLGCLQRLSLWIFQLTIHQKEGQ
ncbi:hypothetical protein PG996_008871 [Apiospora saccharicola]|uniref:Heterokaryon incompatibility domain-containing protein n=1 Tax=Apiospora saccharicola TaxID=335842 RepID=A0ABR1V2C6_9PEZI